MNITYTSYIELPAPCEQVREALADQQVWAALLPGAHKQGQLWRVAGSSYSLSLETGSFDALRGTLRELPAAPQADYTFCWQAAPAVVGAARAQVVVTLHDAVISTHAVVRVSLLDGRRGWPWQRLARRHQIARQVDVCVTRLRVLLSHRVAAPVPVLAGEDDAPSEQRSAAGGNGAQAASTGAAAAVPDKASELAERLRPAYPQTVAHFEQMGALDHLERVWWLERRWEHILRGDYQPEIYERVPTLPASDAPSYDLIYAGGGLGLIHAAVMARCYGWRVLLFDRSQVGCVHREWNISRAELQALVDLGVVSWDDLAPVIMREYRNGVVEFYSGPHSRMPHQPLWMPDVLNLALDAGALLHLMRRVFEQAGGTVLDHRAFKQVRVAQADGSPPAGVEVVLRNMASDRPETYRARLLLDGMGSTSPLALLRHAGRPFAGVCPTVGTVARGFEAGSERQQVDPTLGDILISVADTQDGKQMIWEGFPGRGDELTVYLFYYAALRKAGRARAFLPASASGHAPRGPLGNGKHNGHAAGVVGQPRYSLLALFEQYFALLPSYKRPGPDFAHVKPVYGYIPGRHSVHMQEAPLLTGVLPVGDAAAQQSPLTFCGFGSHIRNLRRTTGLLDTALRRDLLAPDQLRHISAFQVNVSLNWVFSRFMQPWHDPHTVNELQNAFLGALQDLGDGLASRFFRDRMRWHDYNQIVWQTMMRYKQVFIIVWPVLGVAGVRQWAQDYVRFSLSAATAAVAQAAGRPGEYALTRIAELVSPAAALRVQAQYAEWRAMDWL